MSNPNPYQRDDKTWWWYDETWMDYGPFMTPEAATIELEYYCEYMLGVKHMSKVLSLTDSEVGALMNLLEAPEVEINAPEMGNLRRIYEKLSKSKVGKQIVTGSGGIVVPKPGLGTDTN